MLEISTVGIGLMMTGVAVAIGGLMLEATLLMLRKALRPPLSSPYSNALAEFAKILIDRGMRMSLRIKKLILATAAVIIFALAAPGSFAQQDIKGKPTASGQMKAGGKEAGKAGKSLGHNVKHGRIIRGGKRFGKHIGYAGRHVGRGTKHAVKKAVKP